MILRNTILSFLLFIVGIPVFSQQTLNQSDQLHLYNQALDLLDKRNYTAARAGFEQYARQGEDMMKVADSEYYAAYCALVLFNEDGESKINSFIYNHPKHPKAIMANFELGSYYFDQKKYQKSVRYLKKVKLNTLDSKSRAEARYKLGYALFATKKLEEALPYFNALKNKKGRYSVNALYYAGFIEYNNGDLNAALTDLTKAEKNAAYASIVPYMIANIYYKQKKYDTFFAYGEKVLKNPKVKNKRDINLLMAAAYFDKGNYALANQNFKALSSTSGLGAESEYRAGVASYKAKEYNAAIQYLKDNAGSEDSLSLMSSYYLGLSYLQIGNKTFAINAFQQGMNNPELSRAIAEESAYQHAKLVYEVGNTNQAIENLTQFVQQYPESRYYGEINDVLSEAYLSSSDYEAAIVHIESLPKMTWSMKKVYQKATFMKGAELFNKEKYVAALPYFEKSLTYSIDQEYVDKANFWSGEIYSIAREYDQAEGHYRSVVSNTMGQEQRIKTYARYALGYIYYNKKEYKNALMHFRLFAQSADASIDRSTYFDGRIRLADCLYATKEYGEAIKAYNALYKEVKRDKDYILYQKGMVLGMMDNYEGSIGAFNSVVNSYKSSKYFDDALYNKARVELEKGDYQKSIATLTRLIKEKRGSKFVPYAYSKRATAKANIGQEASAIKDYETILNTYTNHSVAKDAILSIQELLNQTGRSNEFDQYLALYKKANPDNTGNLEEVDYQASKNTYFNQEYNNAAKKLRSFLDNYPQSRHSNEAQFYLGESLYRSAEKEKALEQYYPLLEVPAFDYRIRVINRIAFIEYSLQNYQNAIRYFRLLKSEAITKKHEQNATMGLMESYYAQASYDSVQYFANQLLQSGSANISSTNKASLFLGKAAFAKGDYETAKDEFIATLNSAKDVHGAEAQYLLGLIFYQTKEYQKSIDALIELNNEFYTYEDWLGRGFILIADNYIELKENFQAKATLNSVIDADFLSEEIRNEARKKLVELEQQEKMQLEQDSMKVATDSLNIDENE